jgi:NADH:ubiquinone reductase (H+-translocating)
VFRADRLGTRLAGGWTAAGCTLIRSRCLTVQSRDTGICSRRCGPCVGHGGAKYVANLIKAELGGADPTQREPSQYFDKGSMATVSRFSAVAKLGPLEFSGFIAWPISLVLHLVYLIGFKTKITTLLSWTLTFLSTRRGQPTITGQQAFARTRLEQLAELAAEARGSAGTTRVAS